MKYELLIAFKHLFSKKGRSLSLVSTLAISGVALGVAALIGGFSITAGFEEAFRDKLLGVSAHIFIRPYSSQRYDYQKMEKKLKEHFPNRVVGISPTTYHKTILSGVGGTTGGYLKSVIPEAGQKVLKLPDYMQEGQLSDLIPHQKHPALIIGAQLAHRLQVKKGDYITALSSFKDQAFKRAPSGKEAWSTHTQDSPQTLMFKIVGIFKAGYDEYDTRFAYLHLEDANRLFGTSDSVQGYEVALSDPNIAVELSPQIEKLLKWTHGGPFTWGQSLVHNPQKAVNIEAKINDEFLVQDWYSQNPALYMSLLYQRLAILVVLSVMLILASCNVASMLIMMVLERTKEIAILKAMGASEKSIHLIFLIEGLGIALLGSLGGAIVGFLFCEILLGQGVSLDPQVYGIDHFPVIFNGWDYVYSTLGALCIIGFAVHFPARRGGKLKPTEGLREDHLDR